MNSLRARLVVSYLLVSLVVLAGTGVAIYRGLGGMLEQAAWDSLGPVVGQVAGLLVSRAGTPPGAVVEELTRTFPGVRFSYDPNALWPGHLPRGTEIRLQDQGGNTISFRMFYTPQNFPVLYRTSADDVRLMLPVPDRTGRVQGVLSLQAPPPLGWMLTQARTGLLAVIGLGAALAVGAGWLVSRQLLRPLSRLAAAAGQVAEGRFDQQVEGGGLRELEDLAARFNHMAAALDQSFLALARERDRLRQFIANGSHELKTPLAALRAFHDLLENASTAPAETRRELLADARRQVDRLERLIRQLLDLSRLDAGLSPLQQTPSDLRETVAAALAAVTPLAATRAIALEPRLPPEPAVAPHDPGRLEQAVGALLENAIKFTPPGGRVTVELALNTGAHITVSDTGCGIPAEELPYVFERFFRGRATQSVEGSGLGLSIVKALVEAHGGAVTAESPPGGGARFRIDLPAA